VMIWPSPANYEYQPDSYAYLMLRIYLVPPGETDLSSNGEILGMNNPPLNERGLRYAESMAENFKPDVLEAVFTGPQKRQLVTARRIAKPHDLPVRVEKRLRDINYGSWSGSSWMEIEQRFPKETSRLRRKTRFRFPNGEKLKRASRRVVIFSNEIRMNFGMGIVIIVADDFVCSIMIGHLTGIPLKELEPWVLSRGGVSLLECERGRCMLRMLRGAEYRGQ